VNPFGATKACAAELAPSVSATHRQIFFSVILILPNPSDHQARTGTTSRQQGAHAITAASPAQ
jgi:hypothetical protein